MKNKYFIITISLLFFFLHSFSQSYQKTDLGIKAKAGSVQIEIQFYSPETVRILKSPEGSSYIKKSLSVIKEPVKTDFKILEDENKITLQSSAVKVQLNTQTGKITYFTLQGEQLFTEKDNGIQFTPVQDVDTKTFHVRQAFMLDKDEAIYGLGQHQKGMMNQRNQKIFLQQNNMQICIPFFQSIKGYGLFWDNYSPTTFADDVQETSLESEVGDCADYYFMYGGNADGVIAQMRSLTGQVPMFPKWTFGYWQSRERYQSQFETVDVIKKYRELKVPLDGIVQDWQYWSTDDANWNSTEFGNPGFPRPKEMIDSIHNLNAHIIISVWPSFGPKTKLYDEFKKKGMLLNFTTWPPTSGDRPYDAFNPVARDIYWNAMNKNIFSLGMDGWWLDSSEPDHMDPKEGDFDIKTYLGTFRKVCNAFPLKTVGGVSEHQRATTSDKRVFILTRSAFAGQQRYGATSWSGDVQSRWDIFRKQISGGLNFSLTGLPYWNTDIGGFFPWAYPKGVKDPAFQELYVRWLQFGTFSTMMRSHGTDTPREIYQFGKKGDWAYDAIEKFINLRYRLLPYIYSTSWDVTANASTMMRALVMDFAKDKKVQDIDNEYLFGKSILVCPVTDSMYTSRATGEAVVDFSKTKTQKVYLPNGNDWIDFWTGEKLKGEQEIEKEAPIDILPLYVKAGSIIPMGPFQQYSGEKSLDNIELRIYPGADGVFSLYEDENDNYNYEKGAYAIITFKWNNLAKELTIDERKGNFSGMLKNRIFNIILVSKDHGTGAANTLKYNKVIKYTGKAITVKL
jgi:alpha-D-xyloside xylohydrolase